MNLTQQISALVGGGKIGDECRFHVRYTKPNRAVAEGCVGSLINQLSINESGDCCAVRLDFYMVCFEANCIGNYFFQ